MVVKVHVAVVVGAFRWLLDVVVARSGIFDMDLDLRILHEPRGQPVPKQTLPKAVRELRRSAGEQPHHHHRRRESNMDSSIQIPHCIVTYTCEV